MTITISWPMRLVNTLNRREFWAVKAKRVKAQRSATRLMLQAHNVIHVGLSFLQYPRIAVRLVRIYAGRSRAMDDDGVVASFKAIRDEVAAYFGVDDADPRIRFEYAQARGAENLVRIDFAVEDNAQARAEANGARARRAVDDGVKALVDQMAWGSR